MSPMFILDHQFMESGITFSNQLQGTCVRTRPSKYEYQREQPYSSLNSMNLIADRSGHNS